MTAAMAPVAPARHKVRPAALWFGIFGAAAAWSIQELASYAIVTHACYPSRQPLLLPAMSGAWTVTLLLSLLMLLVGLAAGFTAYRAWRRTRLVQSDAEEYQLEIGEGRVRFMALSGVIMSSIFLLNLVMNASVLFMVPPCG